MPWYLYLALKQLFPTGRRFPFFTAISVMGVALGVMVLVVVTSVMGGFGSEIRRMIVETQGEVQIKAQNPIDDYSAAIRLLDAQPDVAAATPISVGGVLVEHSKHVAYSFIQGMDLATVDSVFQLAKYIYEGSLDNLDDDSVILSSQLAAALAANVGDRIEVYSPLLIESLKSDTVVLPREVRVVALMEIGHQQLDSSRMYGTMRFVQGIYGLGHSVHGINVRLKPGTDEDAAAARLNAVLPGTLRAFSWQDSFQEFLWVLGLEKGMIFFLLLIIVVVAAFSVMSSLLISVVRKTREIGLLGALGGRPRQVAACFCAQGFIIGLSGTVLGLALGFALLAVRNDIVLGLARATQREEVLKRFYQFSQLPAHTLPGDVVEIVVFTLVISTLAGLIPAWRAARLKPVEALRNE